MAPRSFACWLLLTPLLAAVGCTSGWEGEAASPQPEWEQPPAPPPVAATSSDVEAEDTDPTAIATFQPVLEPYGTWVEDETYGTVWVPYETTVGAGFSPYLTAGHWSYTDEGYYWASDYEWGWAPFHYGRWVWIEGRGWSWIPGARYSPAWVDWRYGGGYIGWGPMYPRYCWHHRSAVWIDVAPTPYVFAPSHAFFSPHPASAVAGPSMGPGLVAGTQPYPAPPAPHKGARPFVGPDPKIVGIPEGHVSKATIVAPANAKPSGIVWKPVDGSKFAPGPGASGGKAAMAAGTPSSPGLKPGTASGPVYTGPNAAVAKAPTYTGAPTYAKPTYGNPPSTYAKPSYSPPPSTYAKPTYSPPPTAYSPKPTYSPPPTAYSPKPTYSPPTYSPPPTAYKPSYSPPPAAYKPSYSPPPAAYKPSYSPPPVHHAPAGGGYSPSYKPSSPSFGGAKKK